MHTIESLSVEFGVSVETIRAIVSRINNNLVNAGYLPHFKTDYVTRKISAFTLSLLVRGDIDAVARKTKEFIWIQNQSNEIINQGASFVGFEPNKKIYDILRLLSDCVAVNERRKLGKKLISENIATIAEFIDERTKHKPLNGRDMAVAFYLSAKDGESQLMLERTVVRGFMRTLRSVDDDNLTCLWSTAIDGGFIYGVRR